MFSFIRFIENKILQPILKNQKVILIQKVFHVLSVIEFPGQARGVLRESWYNVNFDTNGVPTMRQHPAYKTPPQNQMILQDFHAPVGVGDNYVQRLTSYLQVNLIFVI